MRISSTYKRTSAWICAVSFTGLLLVFFFLAGIAGVSSIRSQVAGANAVVQCQRRVQAGKQLQKTVSQLRTHDKQETGPAVRLLPENSYTLPGTAAGSNSYRGMPQRISQSVLRQYGCVIAYNLGGNSPPRTVS